MDPQALSSSLSRACLFGGIQSWQLVSVGGELNMSFDIKDSISPVSSSNTKTSALAFKIHLALFCVPVRNLKVFRENAEFRHRQERLA